VWSSRREISVCVGGGAVPGLASLRGIGLQSEYCAGLCWSWGHGPVEQR
jgi:hypothetical protein